MPVPEIGVEEFRKRRNAHHGLVDVREPEEFHQGRVSGAVLIPLGQLQDRIAEIPNGGELFVICRSGVRSAHAVEVLSLHGIEATNIAGGTVAWIELGELVETGDWLS